MPGPTIKRTLTLDLATRVTGWAASTEDPRRPVYGFWRLPGMADLGKLYAALRNVLEDAIVLHRPERLVFAPALFREAQTASRALLGLVSVAELVAYDNSVQAFEISEDTARKAVLGHGSAWFAERRPDGKAIKGTASERVKAAAMEWCTGRGWAPQTHDVADSLVLLEYDRLFQASRQPTWTP